MKRLVLALYALLSAACELTIDANLPDASVLLECTENPCHNGGLCESLVIGIRCVCPPGYSGQFCETKESECRASSCQHGGTCVQGDGGYTCTCAVGYQGEHCELSECALVGACLHGTCNGQGGCTCSTGWQGSACDQNVNECAAGTPCLHAGQCTDTQGGFTCACTTGYDGVTCGQCATGYQDQDNDGTCCATGYAGPSCTNCESGYVRVNGLCQQTCASTQTDCGTHGTCDDSGGQVACACESGYFGPLCDSLMGGCTSQACNQHGTCSVTSETTYKCTCNAGFTGRLCEVVDECVAGAPQGGRCSGHGTCVDGDDTFSCTCNTGWLGTTCAEPDDCVGNMCQHGVCVDGDSAYTCDCTGTIYEGQYCQSKIDFCASGPCKNGGACSDGATTFTCDCTGTGFSGTTCESDLDECADLQADVCESGTCINGGSGEGYSCKCPDGTIDVDGDGTHCSSVVSLAAGGLNTCAITSAGSLHCWGDNTSGQLGQGHDQNPGPSEIRTPKRIGTGTGWQKVSVGGAHVCAIRSGHLYCWGDDVLRQVGGPTGFMEGSPFELRPDLTWTDVSLGDEHTCAIAGTALYCWGNSADAQAGTASSGMNVDAPKQIAGTWTSVSAGGFHTCAINTANALSCWGRNSSGQLGGAQPVALPNGADGDWSSVQAGRTHTCAIAGTRAYCWGAGTQGTLGNGMFADSASPALVSSGFTLESLAVADAFSCALVDDVNQSGASQIYCWGSNQDGRLLTSDVQVALPQLVTTAGSPAWTAYAVGAHHMCAVSAGLLYCWGSNTDGAVGGAAPDSNPVTSPRLISSALAPHSSIDHCTPNQCKNGATCTDTGTGYTCNCTGTGFTGPTCTTETNECATANICGQGTCRDLLGGDGYGCTCPDGLIDLDNTGTTCLSAAVVSAGFNHTCVLTTANTLHCWGSNRYGQFGLGAVGTSYYPNETSQTYRTPLRLKEVSGVGNNVSGWTKLAVGESHTCATLPTGSGTEGLYCWGDNTNGQVGRSVASAPNSPAPYLLDDTRTWTALSAGYAHTCGISSGALYCWGYSRYAQAGNGISTTTPVLFSLSTPVALPNGETSWVSVAAGGSHTCAITDTNTTYCWGRRNVGQVGIGATGADVLTPSKVNLADPQGFTAIQTDFNHSCALVGEAAYCWGQGTVGAIGNGVNSNVPSPTAVSGGLSFSSLSLGMYFGCGLVAVDGSSPQAYSAWCWGFNAKNILLNASLSSVNVPTEVSAREWRVFDAGPGHICGVDNSDGKLYCWGDNGTELGVGQGKLGTQPASVLGNFDIAAVKASMAVHAAP